jgi:acyl phosphate:glycerol-3-phosphate acyltransferase
VIVLDLAVIAFLCYLLGSIPTGLLAGRLAGGIDIREHGSGNMGATNSFRVLGWKLGALVAFVDIAKGYVAVALVSRITLFPDSAPPASAAFIVATFAAILGHIKPVFAAFKGGKGFATAAGAICAAYPILAPFCLAIFLVSLTLSGFVAFASSVTALALPFIYLLTGLLFGRPIETPILVFFFLAFAMITLMLRGRLALYFKGEAQLFEKVMLFKPRIAKSSRDSH